MRSSMPPCPGSSLPLSLAPKARLSIDSERSPSGPTTPAAPPIAAAAQSGTACKKRSCMPTPPAIEASRPPMAPSQVLLGEMRG